MIVVEGMYVRGVSPELFVEKAKAKKVELVLDVRRSFYRSPPFYPKAFEELLKPYGIKYIYEKRFGNPYSTVDYPDWDENKRLYQEYVVTKQKELLEEWKRRAKEEVVAVCCWCDTNDPAHCHRFWLQELMEA